MKRRILAFTQGDPAGIGPEVILKALAARPATDDLLPVVVAERAALEAVRPLVPELDFDRLVELASPDREALLALPTHALALVDPVGAAREIEFGEPVAADAGGAMAALDAGVDLARQGVVDAIVTAPVSKSTIARHAHPGFVGHTDYLAAAFGLERYGRDYLMAFLAPQLQVALLSVHEPLARAIDTITTGSILDALACLGRHAGGKIAVAGLNPHAGEGGLLGTEDEEVVRPAVARAREHGLDAHGPESADSLFSRAARGEFDWVLALYHDQGLIAVKTAAFGEATNWTLGLPILRTSVDHGTAYAIAGSGVADARPMAAVIETTLELLEGTLPRKSAR
ncbi:MAG: 4-hydroxythreonine-4-phosphate dehydrogenase PdxA [Thermoanaerobaculia bacterium]|nr:4-hydroxythreonine-4-phosphate dehydrogenase PdxA [Thermoanaerobaculia bacterium]